MAGLIISSRLLGNDYAEKIKSRFERALEDEMTEPDGRILPIRSELTGLTIPGLSGTLSDCIDAMNLTAYLPYIGARVWALIRNEHITYENKKLTVNDLRGADKMDPSNYKSGIGALPAFVAGCLSGKTPWINAITNFSQPRPLSPARCDTKACQRRHKSLL